MCGMPFDKCLRVVPSAIFPAFFVYFFSFLRTVITSKKHTFLFELLETFIFVRFWVG